MTEKTNQSIIINSVDRSLQILEYLFAADEPVALTRISKDLGIYKSTVYRTLATLQNRGYVTQDPETDKYELGFKIHVLGSRMKGESALAMLVEPYIQELGERFHESVNVSKLSTDANGLYVAIVIANHVGNYSLSSFVELGTLSDCYSSSVGKSLLAFTEGINLHVYDKYPMEAHTKNTITDIRKLRAELDKVRQQGYAVDDEEAEPGLYCVGVPILKNGEAVAAISLTGPKSRMLENLDERIEALKEASEAISSELM